ncbi:MAG TPA: DUF4270 family protein [Bacteroidales bacterium]|nr:DUF4270 family protein [Bacteroidales bacterium]
MKIICRGMIKKGTNSLTKHFTFFKVLVCLAVLILASCTKINEFTIGDNFVESQTHLTVIDTFRVDVSTVLLDSLYTSGVSEAYAGRYRDNDFGQITCTSYFTFNYQYFSTLNESAIYDSAALVLSYSGYSLGDTVSLLNLNVHRLTEQIKPFSNNYLYNNTSFEYEADPLGSISFYPAPGSGDSTISIPINSFGEELFDLIKNRGEEVSSSNWFSSYLKGFAITYGNQGNAIIGFKADESHLLIKIYYHENTALPVERDKLPSISIGMGQSNYMFNSLKLDFSDSPLENIRETMNEIPSAESGNRAYLQGITGLLPKFRFPTLQDLLMEKRLKILKAELILEPVKNSYEKIPLPDRLYLYETDRLNRMNKILTDANGDPVYSTLVLDEIFNEETYYTIDITSFLIDELSDRYFDYNHGLLLGLNQNSLKSSFSRLILEDGHPRVKLKLYLLSY